MALLAIAWLYLTLLHSTTLALLDSSMAQLSSTGLYFTLLHSTMALLGSTSLYMTLLHSTCLYLALRDSTQL